MPINMPQKSGGGLSSLLQMIGLAKSISASGVPSQDTSVSGMPQNEADRAAIVNDINQSSPTPDQSAMERRAQPMMDVDAGHTAANDPDVSMDPNLRMDILKKFAEFHVYGPGGMKNQGQGQISNGQGGNGSQGKAAVGTAIEALA